MLLLHADNSEGIAFVDTSLLDGETNLKEKFSAVLSRSAADIVGLQGRLYYDKPSESLDDWNAELMGPGF